MPRPIGITVDSTVAADREDVWRSISKMTGVNYELRPALVMTSPRGHETLPIEVIPGRVIFVSWRTLTALDGGGCRIVDDLVVEPRFGLLRPVTAAVVQRLFTHRHRRLARRFGSGYTGTASAPT